MVKVVIIATGETLSVKLADVVAKLGGLWYGFARVCLAV